MTRGHTGKTLNFNLCGHCNIIANDLLQTKNKLTENNRQFFKFRVFPKRLRWKMGRIFSDICSEKGLPRRLQLEERSAWECRW